MVNATKRRHQEKQPFDEETSGPKRDLDKDLVEDLANKKITKLIRILTKTRLNEHLKMRVNKNCEKQSKNFC